MFNLIAHARGAVIVEEIVMIGTVLWLTVCHEGLEEAVNLGLRQVEQQFADKRTAFRILRQKIEQISGSYLIVGIATHKSPNKMRGVVIKKSIIEHHVFTFCKISDEQGRVTIILIHLLS